MALDATNVRVAFTGALYKAPVGTTLPVTATAALHGAFTDLGYLSEDGVVMTTETNVETIRAWQRGDTVRKVQTEHDTMFAFTLIESKNAAFKAFFGDDNVTGAADDVTIEVNADEGVSAAWVLQVIDTDALIRVVIPNAQVTERGEVQFVNGAPVGYPITVTAYPDASGNKAYIYTAESGAS